jgi:hypothetical protein
MTFGMSTSKECTVIRRLRKQIRARGQVDTVVTIAQTVWAGKVRYGELTIKKGSEETNSGTLFRDEIEQLHDNLNELLNEWDR